jgi:hypothetical protein
VARHVRCTPEEEDDGPGVALRVGGESTSAEETGGGEGAHIEAADRAKCGAFQRPEDGDGDNCTADGDGLGSRRPPLRRRVPAILSGLPEPHTNACGRRRPPGSVRACRESCEVCTD